MTTREAVANRIIELCKKKGFSANGIAMHFAVPQATLKSILNGESQNPGVKPQAKCNYASCKMQLNLDLNGFI